MNRSVRGLGIRTGLGKKDKWLPSVRNGLTFCWHAQAKTGRPWHSAAGTAALTTETVDADRKALPFYGNVLIAGTANTVHIGRNGMLVEPARTNSCLQSEDFGTTWADSGTPTLSTNSDVAPDGATTADTIGDNAADALEAKFQGITIADDALVRVFSVFIKKTTSASTFPSLRITLSGGDAVSAVVSVDTDAGAVTSHVSYPPTGSGVEDYGRYWRAWLSLTNDESGNTTCACYVYPAANADGGNNWDVSCVGTCVFWGAQLEVGSAPSSYIPTTTAAVARAADVLVYTVGTHALPLSMLCAYTVPNDPAALKNIFPLTLDHDLNDRIFFYWERGADKFSLDAVSSGGDDAQVIGTTTPSAGDVIVLGGTLDEDSAQLYYNGVAEGSEDTSLDVFGNAPSILTIGAYHDQTAQILGSVDHVLLYERALSAAEMANLFRHDYQRWMGDRL